MRDEFTLSHAERQELNLHIKKKYDDARSDAVKVGSLKHFMAAHRERR